MDFVVNTNLEDNLAALQAELTQSSGSKAAAQKALANVEDYAAIAASLVKMIDALKVLIDLNEKPELAEFLESARAEAVANIEKTATHNQRVVRTKESDSAGATNDNTLTPDEIYQAGINSGMQRSGNGLLYLMSGLGDLINAIMSLELTVANTTALLAEYLASVSEAQVQVLNQDNETLENIPLPSDPSDPGQSDEYNKEVNDATAQMNTDSTNFNSITSTIQGFISSQQQEYQSLVNQIAGFFNTVMPAVLAVMSNLAQDLH